MPKNLLITNKINELLKKKGLTGYKLSKIIGISDGAIYSMIRGRSTFPEDKIQKIAPVLEVSPEEIKGWILADKYLEEILQRAIELKKEPLHEDNKLILTTKLDELIHKKGLSRTKLSKIIGYSQGRLNEIIIGKKSMSKKVTQKISTFLEVSENELKSWILADKYSMKVLDAAVNALQVQDQ